MDDRSLTDRISDLTSPVCAWCDKPLAGGVSDDFCSPEHQQEWTAYRNDVDELTGYREAASPVLGISDAMNTAQGNLDMESALRAVFADMERDLAEIDARHAFNMKRINRRFRIAVTVGVIAFLIYLPINFTSDHPWVVTGFYLAFLVPLNLWQWGWRSRDDRAWEKHKAQRTP